MPSEPRFVTTEEFIEMTQMELIDLYMLLEGKAITTKRINHHLHIDMNDKVARQYLPDYEPEKDLFWWQAKK